MRVADTMADLSQAVAAILAKRAAMPRQHSVLIGITGIDGSGKGYITNQIIAHLLQQGVKAIGINVDGWLNLPQTRFNMDNPAAHFYEHAIRFDEMFQQLVLPLKAHRTHRVVVDFAEETATAYRKYTYAFEEVDIIVLEGIYLLKHAYRHYFDLAFWVECTFETALERALQRGQEGLPPAETIRAYHTVYFPAQRLHFARDNPRAVADMILCNDPRLTSPRAALASLDTRG